MTSSSLSKFFKAAIVAALAAVVAVWFRERDRSDEPEASGTATWPPLDDPGSVEAMRQADAPAPTAATPTPAAPTVIAEPSDGGAAEAPHPEWVEPNADGSCPPTHPVKVKLSSGIYHMPDGMNYERTKPDRCYVTPAAAEADGYRASKM